MGGPSAATKQSQQLTLQAQQQQLSFDSTLQNLFQQQFANSQSVLSYLQNTAKGIVTQSEAGNGFSPEALAAMRTSATDAVSGEFANAQAALNQTLRSNGDANVPSGVTVGADSALLAQEAEQQAGTQNQITVANAQQSQNNLWNSLNVLNGVAAQDNPLGYASAATGGSGAVAGLGESQAMLQNSITNANSNSFFGKLMSGFATGIGGAMTSGFGNNGAFTQLLNS